ncbi:uncharacterized protein LOC143360700 [Halictus rubicundus]|uniref:uncharacterized protein LOC143360700 n=1 Tax=Halictus rubicundus TaxID=77578 RepID=UPI004035186E
MNDDPREVLVLLNSLGFVGITAQQLKGFMKDLKMYRKVKELERQQKKEELARKIIDKQQNDIRRILREQRRQFSADNVSTDSSTSVNDNPIVQIKVHCVSNDKENREYFNSEDSPLGARQRSVIKSRSKTPSDPCNARSVSTSCDGASSNVQLKSCRKCTEHLRQDTGIARKSKTNADTNKGVQHVDSLQPRRPMSAPNLLEHEQDRAGSSQAKSVLSTKTSQSGTKSFIRPWRLQPEAQKASNMKKSDPVALYQKYQQEWKQMSFPGEAKHAGLRWAIREKMLGGDPHPVPLPRKSTSMPILKKK